MQIKAVIFDLDGTLYDNTKLPRYMVLFGLFHLRMLRAEQSCRKKMSGRFYGRKGPCYDEQLRRMSLLTGRSIKQVSDWYWSKFMPLQVEILKRFFHVKPWVVSTLEELRARGIKTACFSDYSFIEEKLRAIGVDPQLFDFLIDAPTAGGCKPCRKAFVYVSSKLDVYPADILVVGDREDTDGAGADAANMHFLLVPKKDSETLDLEPFLK